MQQPVQSSSWGAAYDFIITFIICLMNVIALRIKECYSSQGELCLRLRGAILTRSYGGWGGLTGPAFVPLCCFGHLMALPCCRNNPCQRVCVCSVSRGHVSTAVRDIINNDALYQADTNRAGSRSLSVRTTFCSSCQAQFAIDCVFQFKWDEQSRYLSWTRQSHGRDRGV